MPYYAVARGRISGIFMNWADCESQVKGFPGARYKKFNTAADAEKFIISEGGSQKTNNVTNGNKIVKATNSQHQPKAQEKQITVKPSRKRTKTPENQIDTDSDEDDLSNVLTKQMDDIEKRLKVFEKDVNKIIKKGTKSTEKKTMLIDLPQPKKHKSGKFEFNEDDDGYVQVYTDGACSSNGRNGARAGIGVYWGDGHPLNVSEPVTGRATNNCGEIQAATSAIKIALQNKVKKLTINTDSQFLINSVTKWMPGWKRKGWKLQSGEPVKNEKDFKELDEIQNKLQIKWVYVEAHKGVHGNEMADQLAKAGASRYVK
ncbi:Ribonuclease H1 [Papilio machaon]|uniref:Ribonuclease H1 n=1 Tax=Papilio machaon TaxID=76193 RepID=A0A194RCW6_PAPMA|nr:Ribonuclease H1 [Papilio machaon]